VSLFAVSAVGRDRPGIVAGVSEILFEMGGNIEDSKMSILRGHFAVMLIVAGPDELDRDQLEARLAPLKEELDLDAIAISDVAEVRGDALDARPTHVVSVYGADHPGIVHAISRKLAEEGSSITDLETKLVGDAGSPIYVMLMEIRLPGEVDVAELGSELDRIGRDARLEVSMSALETDAL
jgi:glycine cleavage system transcriptional repressor